MPERPTYEKSSCCVPFCRRTSRRFKGEWICADHWKLVPRTLKAFRTKRLKDVGREWEKADVQLQLANQAGFFGFQMIDQYAHDNT